MSPHRVISLDPYLGFRVWAVLLHNLNISAFDNAGEDHMEKVTTKDGAEIYYKDWGSGQPIVFSHGWRAVAKMLSELR